MGGGLQSLSIPVLLQQVTVAHMLLDPACLMTYR